MNKAYPIYDWILWRYVSLWLRLMLFSAACTSFGQLLLVRALRLVDLPALESAVISMILGTLSFVMLMYLAGTLGLFNPWFAVAMLYTNLGSGHSRTFHTPMAPWNGSTSRSGAASYFWCVSWHRSRHRHGSIGFQGLISYESMHTPHELYNQFCAHGITHLVHEPKGNYGSPTRQEDIVFHALAAQYGVPLGSFGGLFLTALPQKPPPAEPPYRALCIGQEGLSDGIYPISALRNWSRLPPLYQVKAEPEQEASTDNQAALLAKVDAMLCPPDKCTFPDPMIEVLNSRFELISNRISPWLLYLKR